jgi:hypothetical protein
MTAAPEAPARAADAEHAGRRVEEILDRLAATGDREACAAAEDLVRSLMRFYGAGLARILDLLAGRPAARGDAAPLERLLGDEQVASLLTLHGLHPEDLPARIARALAAVPGRPVELAGHDEPAGVVRVRPAASGGCGCPSTGEAGRKAAEAALACFAPEVRSVELESAGARAGGGPLLQISARPGLPLAAAR